ncbi:MAG: hypothetical protein JXB49_25670, partial [Bacteroidales bacterium]|nr:hypothetical protein [Bacteroidales bacterium]
MKSDKAKDIPYSIIKAGLGAVPIVGSAAIELFTHIVTPPIEKRRIAWMHDIGERLAKLESKHDIELSELQDNPDFIDTVIKTTQYALRTSETEKIEYFRNALINTAIGESPEQSESQIFLNLLDSYTIWHIRILKLFDNPSHWYEANKIEPPQNVMGGGLKIILETAFSELKGRTDFCNLVWEDLKRAGLHNSGSLGTMMTGSGL